MIHHLIKYSCIQSSSPVVILAKEIEASNEELTRLRKRVVKQEFNSSAQPTATERTETSPNNEGALKELEVFKSLAEERLQTMLKLQSQCDQLNSKLRTVQQEVIFRSFFHKFLRAQMVPIVEFLLNELKEIFKLQCYR